MSVASCVANAQASRIVVTGDTTKGEVTIRGHAIYDDTEKPVRRVGVALINTERAAAPQRITVTDGKGDFIFKNVVSGKYRVAVDFGGHTNGYPTNEMERTEGVEVSVDGSSTADVEDSSNSGRLDNWPCHVSKNVLSVSCGTDCYTKSIMVRRTRCIASTH
jgi:hypothetical protein